MTPQQYLNSLTLDEILDLLDKLGLGNSLYRDIKLDKNRVIDEVIRRYNDDILNHIAERREQRDPNNRH